MSKKSVLMAVLSAFLITVAGAAASARATLFFVNQPDHLTFVDMGRVAGYLEDYYRRIGIMNSDDVDKFYEIVRTHGAPAAGDGTAQVALVLEDVSHGSNSTGVPRGVMVIKGKFDKEKVLAMLRKNYVEHMAKTEHTPVVKESEVAGGKMKAHKFSLPGERERDLTLISFGDYCLFQSAARGDNDLLNRTVKVLGTNAVVPQSDLESNFTFTMSPSSSEKEMLQRQIDRKYENFKAESLRTSKRRGLKAFFVRRIADHKVGFIKDALDEMGEVSFDIFRMKNDLVDMKRLQVVSNFEDEDTARKVKRKLLNHLNDAIKGADNPEDKLGLSSNVRVIAEGNTCSFTCELGTEEEQLHCFSIISSYVSRSILRK